MSLFPLPINRGGFQTLSIKKFEGTKYVIFFKIFEKKPYLKKIQKKHFVFVHKLDSKSFSSVFS
jgi:hypothetical protein